MKKFQCLFAVCLPLTLANAVAADDTPTNPIVRLTLDISDGSRLVGIPATTSIQVQTCYAKMDIPFMHIRSVTMESDHETVSLVMANGDRLKGVHDMLPLEMETIFGKIRVDPVLIRKMQVQSRGIATLPPELREVLAFHYSFDHDEGTTVRDETGKTGAGKVNGAKWTPDGKIGGAYEFNGRQDYVVTPTIDSTGDITWSVWIFPRSFPTANDTYAQFLGARGHAWICNSDNTSLSFNCQDAFGRSRLALQFFVMGPTGGEAGYTQHVFEMRPEPNRWYHVAGAVDSAGTHLYLDGKLLSESTDTVRLSTPCPLIIGANDNGPQRYFDGLIDEVMVFKKAFSSKEIALLYDSQR